MISVTKCTKFSIISGKRAKLFARRMDGNNQSEKSLKKSKTKILNSLWILADKKLQIK